MTVSLLIALGFLMSAFFSGAETALVSINWIRLEHWLEKRPDAKLLVLWKGYVTALVPTLTESAQKALKEDLLGRARAVATAAGGLLGFGNKVSASEQAVLEELEKAFG